MFIKYLVIMYNWKKKFRWIKVSKYILNYSNVKGVLMSFSDINIENIL